MLFYLHDLRHRGASDMIFDKVMPYSRARPFGPKRTPRRQGLFCCSLQTTYYRWQIRIALNISRRRRVFSADFTANQSGITLNFGLVFDLNITEVRLVVWNFHKYEYKLTLYIGPSDIKRSLFIPLNQNTYFKTHAAFLSFWPCISAGSKISGPMLSWLHPRA